MGFWHETCMAFNLPITLGERCIAVVLLEHPYSQDGVYPTTNFHPILAIPGEYNNYGGLDNIADEQDIVALLRQIPNLRLRNQKARSLPYVPDSVNDFIEATRNGLHIGNKNAEYGPSWKHELAVHTIFLKPSFIELAGTDPKNTAFLNKMAGTMTNIIRRLTDTDVSVFELELRRSITDVMNLISYNNHNPAAFAFQMVAFPTNPQYIAGSNIMLAKATAVLNALRKSWHIPSGTGSQNNIQNIYSNYLNTYITECHSLPNDEGSD